MNNFKPVFVDVNLNNLSMNIDQVIKKINRKTLAVFITHAQGFNGLNEKLIGILKKKKIFLIEDVCESHGATFNNVKLGKFGLISNFFILLRIHHMTTIEGGMISTNDKKIDELAKILRSHGMLRETPYKKNENKLQKKFKNLSPKFIFFISTLNFRNNEIGALIGINQLKKLNINNKKRTINYKIFLRNISPVKYFTDFDF